MNWLNAISIMQEIFVTILNRMPKECLCERERQDRQDKTDRESERDLETFFKCEKSILIKINSTEHTKK